MNTLSIPKNPGHTQFMNAIEALAIQQLKAYNASDLEAFVACYHPDVQVFEGEKKVTEGREAFRERYRRLFEEFTFEGIVPKRLATEDHCVDLEHYWREDPETKERKEGSVLVAYTLRDALIGEVRFLR